LAEEGRLQQARARLAGTGNTARARPAVRDWDVLVGKLGEEEESDRCVGCQGEILELGERWQAARKEVRAPVRLGCSIVISSFRRVY